MNTIDNLAINSIRILSADAIQKANSGHPGLPLGSAPAAYELWAHHMNHNPANPEWANRDRFILSGGHGSMLLYSLLHLFGYGLTKEDLMNILLEKLTPLAEKKAIPERSLRDDISVLLNMYVKEKQQNYDPEENKISPFAQLGLLKKDRNNYIKTQPDKDKLCDDAVLYSLIKFFEKKEVDSIGIDELLNSPMSPGRILNLKRMALNEYLDHLEGQGYLTVNRTAGLDMVYLKKKIELKEVVSNYYKKH